MQEKKGGQKLKSISVLVPFERVQASLSEIGFLLDDTVTIVADGKFWNKMLYVRNEETISVSEEIGDAYPKESDNHYLWLQDDNIKGSQGHWRIKIATLRM